MDKASILQKLDEYVREYREQLEKHDGSSMTTISSNAQAAFERLKDSLMAHEQAKSVLAGIREGMGKVEEAFRQGDKKLSAKTLELMEKAVADLKRKANEDAEISGTEQQGAAQATAKGEHCNASRKPSGAGSASTETSALTADADCRNTCGQ